MCKFDPLFPIFKKGYYPINDVRVDVEKELMMSRKGSLLFSSTSLVNCMSVFFPLRWWWNASIRRVKR